MHTWWRTGTVVAAATLAVGACVPLGSLGGLGDVVLGGMGQRVDGQVRGVDSRRDRLTVRDRRGRDETLRYDRRTVVVYERRQYSVSVLERGDQVRVQVGTSRSGNRLAERIDVVRSARDDRGNGNSWGNTTRVDGRVRDVDTRRGRFTMERSRGNRLVVYVPPRVSREDARRFQRLRRGDRVRADVRSISRNEAELVRFR